MRYCVEFAPSAARHLKKLSDPPLSVIIEKIEALKHDPRPPGVEKIKGHSSLYRVRVGEFRVVYKIDDSRASVEVTRIGDRKEVYRRL